MKERLNPEEAPTCRVRRGRERCRELEDKPRRSSWGTTVWCWNIWRCDWVLNLDIQQNCPEGECGMSRFHGLEKRRMTDVDGVCLFFHLVPKLLPCLPCLCPANVLMDSSRNQQMLKEDGMQVSHRCLIFHYPFSDLAPLILISNLAEITEHNLLQCHFI